MFGLTWKSETPNRSAAFAGYLHKMKRKHTAILPQWTKRWFSIEGANLKWYESKDSVEPNGILDLKQVTAISEFEKGAGGSFR